MEMTQIKIGIDNGNYNTKSSERMLYASGFALSDREFITSDMQLFCDGSYYAIGGKRMNFQQEKTKQNDTFILSLPAIANAMKSEGVSTAELILGVGLPIDIYGTQKEAFGQYFLRNDIRFQFEESNYHCRITECKVFAQGHAALCKYYQQLKEYTSITLVDIGGYTVDVLTLHNFKVDRSSCASLRMGTITLFNDIRSELQQENIILSDALIADAINGRIQHAEKNKIQAIVEHRMQHYLKELLGALRERGLDLMLPVVFVGGGAELLNQRLHTSEVNTIVIFDRFANAEGYKLLLG
jgi:plasmid segregation protein ParM